MHTTTTPTAADTVCTVKLKVETALMLLSKKRHDEIACWIFILLSPIIVISI
jgi:hypothetical protein